VGGAANELVKANADAQGDDGEGFRGKVSDCRQIPLGANEERWNFRRVEFLSRSCVCRYLGECDDGYSFNSRGCRN
jgi:hypothetical protein